LSEQNWRQRVNNPFLFPAISNDDGTTSTHRMAAEVDEDGNWFVFPTIVQKEDGSLHQFSNAFEAMRWNKARGEAVDFGKEKEAAINYAKGAYKTDQLKKFGQGNEDVYKNKILQSILQNRLGGK